MTNSIHAYIRSAKMIHKLFHITSLDRLCSIVRSGQFMPTYNNEYSSDSGINAGVVDFPLSDQYIEARGVILILEFHGALREPPENFPRPIGAIYYDLAHGKDLLWRVTVPYGTKSGLHMIGLKFEKDRSWLDAIPHAPQWLLIPKLKSYWRKSKALKLEKEIMTILGNKPLLIVGR